MTAAMPLPPDALAALQRFGVHAATGARREALQAASDACHAATAHAEPHYAYGQAWLAMGEPRRAAEAFAAAVDRAPGWAEAWVNLGLARYRQGLIFEAMTATRAALRCAPGHPAATSNLGAFMRLTGEAEQAETLLRQAIDRDPGNAGARLNLVAELLQEQRPADVLALLDDAPERPQSAAALRHWNLQRSLALLQLGRVEEAARTLDDLAALGPVPPAQAPLVLWRQLLLAQARRDPDGAERAAQAMTAALDEMGPDAVSEHRIMGHYDLAKFWSGRGDHAAAFKRWQSGHALLRPMQPFSRADHAAFIDATIAQFDAARLARPPRAANADPAPVFIVGMPRSGTTLCEQILAAHAEVHGGGERISLATAFTRLGGGGGGSAAARIAGLDAASLDAAAAEYLADLHALAPDKARIVDKMPGNYLHLGLVGLMLPGAKVIHCVRDPRDIGLSIFTFRFHGAHGYAHDLADLGWTIAQQTRLMAHWRAALPNPVLAVALADWVTDFDGTLARVLAHVGLPHDPACVRFHEAGGRVRTVSRAQVREPVNARGLGRWRGYAAELAPLIAELEAAGILSAWDAPGAPR